MPRHHRRGHSRRHKKHGRALVRIHGARTVRNHAVRGHAGVRLTRTTFDCTYSGGPIGAPVYLIAIADASGTLSGASCFGSGASAQAFPGWASYAALFSQYKVHSLCYTFRLSQISNGTFLAPPVGVTIRARYQYDTTVANNQAFYQIEPDVQEFTFSPEHQSFCVTVFPKVKTFAAAGVLFSSGEQYESPGWSDTADPILLFACFAQITDVPPSFKVTYDLTYDISFRALKG